MRKSVYLWLVSLVSLLVSSCATNYSPTPYWLVPEQALYNLKPGVTTKEDVLRNVGEPLMRSYFPRQNQEVWDYSYLEGSAMRMAAYLYFDGNGRYLYSAHVLDPAYWNAEGGVSK